MRTAKKRTSRGMTLTEMLVAVLIFSLVAAGMASGIGAAVNAYDGSVRTSEAQTLCNTITQAVIDILHNSSDAVDSASAPTVTHKSYGENVSFSSNDGRIYFGGKKLLGSGAYTNLNAGIACSCTDSVFNVTVTISNAGGKELLTESFSVRVAAS